MKILLFDHMRREKDEERPWRRVLGSLLCPGCDYHDNVQEFPTILGTPDCVAFLHFNLADPVQWKKWFRESKAPGHLVFVSREGCRGTEVNTEFERIHYCWWGADDFSKLPQPKMFLDLLNQGNFKPELLRPQGLPADILAFLLAEHFAIGTKEQKAKWQEAAEAEFTLRKLERAQHDDRIEELAKRYGEWAKIKRDVH